MESVPPTGPGQPGKKEICSALTGVVKRSSLSVDPKQFFFMVNSQFSLLSSGGGLDLTPLWGSLAKSEQPDVLVPIFLRFERAARKLGIARVTLPEHIAALTDDMKEQLLADAEEAEPIPLPRESLSPVAELSPDQRQRLVTGLINALRSTRAGNKINGAQLVFLIENNFAQLCDGKSFDLRPIVDALLAQGNGVEITHIFEGTVKAKTLFDSVKIALIEPEWPFDEATKQQLILQAKNFATQPEYTPVLPAAALKEIPAPKEAPSKGQTATDRRLAKWGLKRMPRGRMELIRAGGLALAIVAIGVGGYLTLPERGLSVERYRSVFPIASAHFRNGRFVGRLDRAKWDALKADEKKKALATLAKLLEKDQRSKDALIVDEKGLTVMWYRDANAGIQATASLLE